METIIADPSQSKFRNTTLLCYVLYALSPFLGGLPAIVAIIINYLRRPEMLGTIYASHMTYQIRTCWFGLLWSIVTALTAWFGVGLIVLVCSSIWFIYRMVKGYIAFSDNREIN